MNAPECWNDTEITDSLNDAEIPNSRNDAETPDSRNDAQCRETTMEKTISLREKFFGCIVGDYIGSAMGAAVENWSYERIEAEFGTLFSMLPYEHYFNGWVREPGTTEDGVERQKLMVTAIMEKKDRVTPEDVRRIWVRDIKPGAAGGISEPFEGVLLKMAKTAVPAAHLGFYCDYSGLVSFSRSCHPIALMNAGDVENAIRDVYEVGQLYQLTNSRGLKWAAVTGAAIAAATRPGATVDSVIGAVFDHCDSEVVREIDHVMEETMACRDFRELRVAFDRFYSGDGSPYRYSYANEIVTKAMCIFRMVGGNLREAMTASVNMGRDTDCAAAVTSGIAGALTGAGSIPEVMIRQVDHATSLNPFTNVKRTLREEADGLYDAFIARLGKMKEYAGIMLRDGTP